MNGNYFIRNKVIHDIEKSFRMEQLIHQNSYLRILYPSQNLQ